MGTNVVPLDVLRLGLTLLGHEFDGDDPGVPPPGSASGGALNADLRTYVNDQLKQIMATLIWKARAHSELQAHAARVDGDGQLFDTFMGCGGAGGLEVRGMTRSRYGV